MNPLLNTIKNLESEFIELIHKRFGLIIHVNQARGLAKTISEACQQFKYQPHEYLSYLKQCSSNSPLLAHLVAGVTVGESYFFRDKHQMSLLEKKILPELIQQRKKEGRLKIWSAGCATGEEIYTITILLAKLIPDWKKWDLQLLGTDINMNALEKAQLGIYGQWSMRSIAADYVRQYFTQEGRSHVLSPDICKQVDFKYLNLSDNSYPSLINGINSLDLILCRNVLIYFDNDAVAHIMKKLSRCLVPGGYLLLGASDPIVTTETRLAFHHEEAIYFSLEKLNEQDADTYG